VNVYSGTYFFGDVCNTRSCDVIGSVCVCVCVCVLVCVYVCAGVCVCVCLEGLITRRQDRVQESTRNQARSSVTQPTPTKHTTPLCGQLCDVDPLSEASQLTTRMCVCGPTTRP